MIQTVFYFFIVLIGIGAYFTTYTRDMENYLHCVLLSLGYGIMATPTIFFLFQLLNIPLHYSLFLVFAAGGYTYAIWKGNWSKDIKKNLLNKRTLYLAVALLIAAGVFSIMAKGAFNYPYLENDDPWNHAVVASYVAQEYTYKTSADNRFSHYIEPYPPFFGALMGILHQTNDSVQWTLKFFNALLVGLAILFAFIAARAFFDDDFKALIVAIVLAVIPSFMSHFIWAQTLSIVVFFPTLYALVRSEKDRRFRIPCAVGIATLVMTQPSSAFILGLFIGIYLAVRLFSTRFRQSSIVIAPLVGLAIGSMYWISAVLKFGWSIVAEQIGISSQMFTAGDLDTSAGVVYGVKDFLIAPLASKIDQATGWGWTVTLLLVISLVVILSNRKNLNEKTTILLLWFFLGLLGVEGNALPFKLFPHRFWAFLAIPLSMIIAHVSGDVLKKMYGKNMLAGLLISALILLGVFFSSMIPKYSVQTAIWPPGVYWSSQEQLQGYVQMGTYLGKKTKVYPVCGGEKVVIGFDFLAEPWDKKITNLRKGLLSNNTTRIYDALRVLKEEGYNYVIIDTQCNRIQKAQQASTLLLHLKNQTVPVFSNKGFALLQLT